MSLKNQKEWVEQKEMEIQAKLNWAEEAHKNYEDNLKKLEEYKALLNCQFNDMNEKATKHRQLHDTQIMQLFIKIDDNRIQLDEHQDKLTEINEYKKSLYRLVESQNA